MALYDPLTMDEEHDTHIVDKHIHVRGGQVVQQTSLMGEYVPVNELVSLQPQARRQ